MIVNGLELASLVRLIALELIFSEAGETRRQGSATIPETIKAMNSPRSEVVGCARPHAPQRIAGQPFFGEFSNIRSIFLSNVFEVDFQWSQ